MSLSEDRYQRPEKGCVQQSSLWSPASKAAMAAAAMLTAHDPVKAVILAEEMGTTVSILLGQDSQNDFREFVIEAPIEEDVLFLDKLCLVADRFVREEQRSFRKLVDGRLYERTHYARVNWRKETRRARRRKRHPSMIHL